jgi:hypothetical protein
MKKYVVFWRAQDQSDSLRHYYYLYFFGWFICVDSGGLAPGPKYSLVNQIWARVYPRMRIKRWA